MRWRLRRVHLTSRRTWPRASIGSRCNYGARRIARRAPSVETRVDEKSARVDVSVRVTPGPRSILRDVVVEGGDSTKPTIARSITLATDAPLDPLEIRETRRRLYNLDVYRSVDIQVQPVASATGPPSATAPAEQPVMARIVLEERPRYRVRYGLAVSDEEIGEDQRDRRLGFAADVENRNVSVARQPRACRYGCVAISRWAGSRSERSVFRAATSLNRVHRTPARKAQPGRGVSDHLRRQQFHRGTVVQAAPGDRAPLWLRHRAQPYVHPHGHA